MTSGLKTDLAYSYITNPGHAHGRSCMLVLVNMLFHTANN